jgi:2-keto-4-pentenoate hydratase/2-oxohepta-3-ene-1,7-dioic acid hydratase in catechol pathway
VRLVTFIHPTIATERVGVLHGNVVVDPTAALYAQYVAQGADPRDASRRAAVEAPGDMVAHFAAAAKGESVMEAAIDIVERAGETGDETRGPSGESATHPVSEVTLLAPVPRPPRIRDYLTFSGHAAGSGMQLPEAFDEMPICYKCNVDSVIGPNETIIWPTYTKQLDYELEIGFFVSRPGRNLTLEEASGAIAGVTIFNDVSARDIQSREMSLGIGPSKGKDFCTVMGPCVVTMDEIDEWSIELTARVNGEIWSEGTTAERRYSFAEVLAWASYCEDVFPGEFLAVGTIGGGCGYELDRWIQPGDVVELSSPQIGTLRNQIGIPEEPGTGAGLASYVGAPRVSPVHH